MTININKCPIEASHVLKCPSCLDAVFIAHPTSTEVPGGGYWLNDGDTVGGLREVLSESQKNPSAFYAAMCVGHCRHCFADYYVVTARFMSMTYKKADDYLHENAETELLRNYQCECVVEPNQAPIQWLLSEHRTPIGLLHNHDFGPYLLTKEIVSQVIGWNGVSCCHQKDGVEVAPWKHAKDLLLSLWDELRHQLEVLIHPTDWTDMFPDALKTIRYKEDSFSFTAIMLTSVEGFITEAKSMKNNVVRPARDAVERAISGNSLFYHLEDISGENFATFELQVRDGLVKVHHIRSKYDESVDDDAWICARDIAQMVSEACHANTPDTGKALDSFAFMRLRFSADINAKTKAEFNHA